MLRFFLVLAFKAILIFSSFVAFAQPRPYPEWAMQGDKITEREGRGLVIRSTPGGAQVFIDGIERGQTPLRLQNLRPGRYFIRLVKDSYSERRFSVQVRADGLLDITLALKEARGSVIVRIKPEPGSPEPDVLPMDPVISAGSDSDESKWGDEYILSLPVGFRTIRATAFGWEEASSTVYVADDTIQSLDIILKPASFRILRASLNRTKFNPGNAASLGSTTFSFEVSAPGKGTFSVLDDNGVIVFARDLGNFTDWSQSCSWNGRDNRGLELPNGEYSLVLRLESLPWDGSLPLEETFILKAELDSSGKIYPLSISSGKAGLLFAPLSGLLPRDSFQIEGSLLFGNPLYAGGSWRSLPFSVGFRVSLLERIEVSAALDALPVFGEELRAGFGGAAKWVFLNPDAGGIFGAAAGVSFSWVQKVPPEHRAAEPGLLSSSVTPFGMASGIELFFPLQIEAGSGVSFVFSPSCLWTGEERLEPVPRLVLTGGSLLRWTYLSAGFSGRIDFDFTGPAESRSAFMTGAELKFFPPPSSLVFSLLGGLWVRDSHLGAFGGAGIGMIY